MPSDKATISNLLVSVEGKAPARYLLNGNRIGIGRAPDNQVRIDHPTISQSHLELRRTPHGSLEIFDLGSRNGVNVNGEDVKRAVLMDGDKIAIGKKVQAYFMELPKADVEGSQTAGLTERISLLEKAVAEDEKEAEGLRDEIKRLEDERLKERDRCELLESVVGETIEKLKDGTDSWPTKKSSG